MKLIELTKGQVALVDDKDFELLNQWKWCCSSGYAARAEFLGRDESGKQILRRHKMHRVILGALPGQFVDHINGVKLDNRRDNLRLATRSQNGMNRTRQNDNTSGYKGVSWLRGKWAAKIRLEGIDHHLGLFHNPEDAALAYDEAARKHFKEFAKLNFPEVASYNCDALRTNGQRHCRPNMSGYRGVLWDNRSGKWYARIKVDGSSTRLGTFETPEEAALCYDKAAFSQWGRDAILNFFL